MRLKATRGLTRRWWIIFCLSWMSRMLDMPMLPVGTYTLRAIDDTNGNGRWDTGSYREGRQPERIVLYDKGIDVRANWDQELDWDIGPELAK